MNILSVCYLLNPINLLLTSSITKDCILVVKYFNVLQCNKNSTQIAFKLLKYVYKLLCAHAEAQSNTHFMCTHKSQINVSAQKKKFVV